ncbi:MAG: efflux RND transporter periplasmic adaptor subunit [Anaerolineales bacterium]|nr:efflux RND transporter periplasmic adaptor subunit [Anaerolineales bacterium]
MTRRKGFWIVFVVVLLVAAAAGAYYYDSVYLPSLAPEEIPLQTAAVRRGQIVISASGVGTVIPAAEVDLGFQGSGLLTEVLVRVGDQVRAGDPLARLADTQARRAVISAQLQVLQAEEALTAGLDTDRAEQEAALAQANLAIAQLKLDDLLGWTPDERIVEQAQASLEAAEANYEAVTSRSAYDVTLSARISLEQAQQSLVDSQAAYDTAWEPARDWELYMTEPTSTSPDAREATGPSMSDRLESERASAERALQRAQQNLEIAQASYNLAWSGINDSDKLNAWNNVLNAQTALEAAQTGPDELETQSAQIQVLQAEISLTQAQAELESSTEQLELTLAQAELNLEIAQEDLEGTTLRAPTDGTVMAVSAQVGESVGGAALVTIADVNQPTLEIYLDETDLNNIGVGFEVEVVLDALPDDVFTGHVVQVDPGLVTISGVTGVRALAQLDPSSYAKPQALPIGANAAIDVIGGRAENALLVPVEALNEIAPGKYAVFVMDPTHDEPVFTLVEVGLMDYSFAEIISGVDLGDVVTTGIVETN